MSNYSMIIFNFLFLYFNQIMYIAIILLSSDHASLMKVLWKLNLKNRGDESKLFLVPILILLSTEIWLRVIIWRGCSTEIGRLAFMCKNDSRKMS
jgi:hypothetical protein